METLIDLYFLHMNTFLPLLHRPTFEKAVSERLHLCDEGFGATVLLVCAVGSRYSGDMRVNLEGEFDAHRSSGWKWFVQVQKTQVSSMEWPTLHELQKCVVCHRSRPLFSKMFSHSYSAIALSHVPRRLLNPTRFLDNSRSWHSNGAGCRRSQEADASSGIRVNGRAGAMEACVLVSAPCSCNI